MFSINKKLEVNLRSCLKSRCALEYRVLIKYKAFENNISKKISSYRGELIRNIPECNLISARLNAKSIYRLIEYPEIEYICFDEYLFLCGMSIPTANNFRLSPSYNLSGSSIGVAIIDSGVYPHTDLLRPSSRIYTFTDLINNLKYPYDDNGHGTCTCGIIAGSGVSSNGMYKGVAPECNIHCYKAFDKLGKGYTSDILFALQDILLSHEKNNIKVICLPFELLSYNKFIQDSFDILLKTLTTKNITPVIASGSNKNLEGSITGLALSKYCITVSGLDTTTNTSPYIYSSSGYSKKLSKPNVAAACVDVVSLNCNAKFISEKNGVKLYPPKLSTSYKAFTGTSIAAAYIAGLCTLLYQNNPILKFNDIASLLNICAVPSDLDKFYQGEGLVNLNRVLSSTK